MPLFPLGVAPSLQVPGLSASGNSAVTYTPPANVNAPTFLTDYLTALSNRIVIAPPGSGLGQIGGFVFDYTGDEVVTMNNEVTDHWLEDNTAVQDHIGVRPTTVTLKGFTSELAFTTSIFNLLSSAISGIENGFSTLGAYLGKYTPGTTDALINALSQAENLAIQLEQAAARGAQIYSLFETPGNWTKQQKAFGKLSAYRIARTVFSVYTPFQVFQNMVITNLQAKQGADSRTMSDFTVTMKQLNFVTELSQPALTNQFSNVPANSPVIANGATAGTSSASVTVASVPGFFAPAAAP